MDSRPNLPPRRRQERGRHQLNADVIQDPGLLQLKKQLLGHPVFHQVADQPEKLAAIFQNDPVLQHAAAASPELAQLLDPATMRQALEVMMQPNADSTSTSSLQLPRKALMQLQNYAMQLQHNNKAVDWQWHQQQRQQQQQLQGSRGEELHSRVDADAADQHAEGVSAQQQHMWDALQQRFSKLHHRCQMLGTAGVLPDAGQQQQQQQQQQQPQPQHSSSAPWPAVPQRWNQQQQPPRILETLVESPLAARQATAAGAIKEAALEEHHKARLSDGSRTMEELLAAFPGMLGAEADGPLYSSHATIGLMSALQPTPTVTAGLHTCSLPNPQQPLLSCNRSAASPFSPDWQQQQQRQSEPGSSSEDGTADAREVSGRSVWPLSGSDPAVSCEGAAGPAAGRPSSALGHRILRPHSSSPIPLGSGSTPLGITRLGSGELVVEITPPTKISTELSWSVDPDASYVLDASTSGSIGGPAAVPGAMSAGSGMHRSSSTNLDGFDSAVLARSSSSGGPGGCIGIVLSTNPRMEAPEGAAAAVEDVKPRVSSSSSTGSAGKEAPAKRSRHQAAATLSGKAATAKRPALTSVAVNKVRQQQQAYEQSQGGQLAGIPAANAQQQQAGTSVTSNGRQESALPVSHGPPNSADARLGSISLQAATPSAAFSSSGAVKAMLSPRSYYEDVAPSSWRPSDAAEYPGDYLELYRRAYCSYADALFPPVWLALTAFLASSRLLSLWQLLLVGLLSFWGGMYIMAVRWAGVPTKQLSLSRVTPMLVVSLEIVCFGVFLLVILPAMWLGHAAQCLLLLVCGVSTLALHLLAHLQDPGYSTIPDAEEGQCARSLPTYAATAHIHGPSAAAGIAKPGSQAAAVAQQSVAGFGSHQRNAESTPLLPAAAAAAARGVGPAGKQQQASGGPKLAGRSLTSCWTCGVERNMRSKHCPICKRCVERFDHHCPVIGNCVGARNHKTFVIFLMTLFIGQIIFAQLLGDMLVQRHAQQITATQQSVPGLPGTNNWQYLGKQSEHLLATHAMSTTAPAAASIAGSSLGHMVPGTAGMGLKSVAAVSDSSSSEAVAGSTDYSANIVISNTVAGGIDSTTTGPVPTSAPGVGTRLVPTPAGAAATTTDSGSTQPSNENLEAAAAGIEAPGTTAALDPVNSRAAELEVMLAAGSNSRQMWWLRAQALWTAADASKGLLLLLLLQVPGLVITSSLLFRALFLAAANLTVNEWLNRNRYLYLQHSAAGFCNRFDRGPAHNCWEFWCGPAVVDWWEAWQQGDQEMSVKRQSVLSGQSATVWIRFWDSRWAKYQQRLTAARERKREQQLQRRMAALGLADKTHG